MSLDQADEVRVLRQDDRRPAGGNRFGLAGGVARKAGRRAPGIERRPMRVLGERRAGSRAGREPLRGLDTALGLRPARGLCARSPGRRGDDRAFRRPRDARPLRRHRLLRARRQRHPKIATLLLAVPETGRWGGLGLVAVAMAAGGWLGARRVAETMSRRITDIRWGGSLDRGSRSWIRGRATQSCPRGIGLKGV